MTLRFTLSPSDSSSLMAALSPLLPLSYVCVVPCRSSLLFSHFERPKSGNSSTRAFCQTRPRNCCRLSHTLTAYYKTASSASYGSLCLRVSVLIRHFEDGYACLACMHPYERRRQLKAGRIRSIRIPYSAYTRRSGRLQ